MVTAEKSLESGPVSWSDKMPPELHEAGWTLTESYRGGWRARNERLSLLGTQYHAKIDDAIQEAYDLDRGKAAQSPDALPPRKLSLSVIRTDGGTQPRQELDLLVVDRYAEEKREGANFPPITVFFDGVNYWLADGFHRYFADRKNETEAVPVDLRNGTQRDAILHSLGANALHGLPRSNDDKRRAVLEMLKDPEWREWSDGVIAQKTNVSQPFVSKLRRELDSQNVLSDQSIDRSIDRPSDHATAQPTVRRGADDVVRETKSIGRRAAEPTSDVKVVDKRRFAETESRASAAPATKTRPSIEEILKGRKLAVSFVWIPGVKGKVSVSVNAGAKPELASRSLIDADKVRSFPEEVLQLITTQLKSQKAPPKASTSKTKKPAKSVARKAPKKPAPKKPARKPPAKKKARKR